MKQMMQKNEVGSAAKASGLKKAPADFDPDREEEEEEEKDEVKAKKFFDGATAVSADNKHKEKSAAAAAAAEAKAADFDYLLHAFNEVARIRGDVVKVELEPITCERAYNEFKNRCDNF